MPVQTHVRSLTVCNRNLMLSEEAKGKTARTHLINSSSSWKRSTKAWISTVCLMMYFNFARSGVKDDAG